MNPTIHPPSRPRSCVSAVALVLSLALFFTGCTSLQSVPLAGPTGPTSVIRPGDFVQAQTKDGQSQSFKVAVVEPDGLTGRDISVKYADMAVLQVRRTDKTKTTWAVVIGILVLVGVAGAVAASAGPMLPSPLFPAGTTF